MNALLKASCLAIYLLALAGLFVELPFGITTAVQYAAVILLVAHLLEVFVALGSIRLYEGPLLVSVALTLLFGFLHWWPLARQRARAANRRAG
jgi:hypothetical protein